MQWEGDTLKQKLSPVGPERKKNDIYPSLDGFIGDLFEMVVLFFCLHCSFFVFLRC